MEKKGMTLLELLIASGILVVAVCGILATFINFRYLTTQSKDRTIAAQDASAIIERIRNVAPFTNANVVAQYPNGAVVSNFGSLPAATNEQVTVSYTNTAAAPLEVIVTVRWQHMGRPMQVVCVQSMTYR